MSDLTPARPTPGHDASAAHDHVMRTISGAGPVRPEEGSALERLLRRQAGASATGRLLQFVPAQVR